ncbi:MAG: hypothetical protein WBM02_07475 [bacterium]
MKKAFIIILGLLTGAITTRASSPDLLSRVWKDKSSGILDLSLVSIDIDVSGRRILCASNTRVYLSENKGQSWQMVLKPRQAYRWDEIKDEETAKVDKEDEETEIDVEKEFDRSEYDEEELYELEILDFEEELDSISDDELKERLEKAGIFEAPEGIKELDDDDDAGHEEDAESFFETDNIIIRQVCWNPVFSQYAYAATNQGLYISSNAGRNWLKISVTNSDFVEDILSVTVASPDGLVIAVLREGIFVSEPQGTSFSELNGVMPNQVFIDIETDQYFDNSLVVLSENSIYWGKIGEIFQTETIDRSMFITAPHFITVTDVGLIVIGGDNYLGVMTETGHWRAYEIPGLLRGGVQQIDHVPGFILAATNRGVFIWNISTQSGRYHNVGLTDYDVRDIAVNFQNPEEIWIATASGVYLLSFPGIVESEIPSMKFLPEKLPALEELIKVSLHHAEIDLFRDRIWFERKQRGVWLPEIDFTCRIAPRVHEKMTSNTVIAVTKGTVFTGPISERYDQWDRDLFRVHVELSWKPNLMAFNQFELSIQQRIRSENVRKNRQMKNIRKLYILLAQLYRDRQLAENMQEEIDNYIKIQQVQAQLNALTGYSFDQLLDKVYPKL